MALSIQALLKEMVDLKGTDLHVTTNNPPSVRVHGSLQNLD